MAFKLSSAEKILKQCTGKLEGGILPTAYLAFLSSAPADDGTGFTEISGGSYARILLGRSDQSATQKMGTPSNRHIENAEIIYGAETTASWSGITHWALFTSATGGTPELWGAVNRCTNNSTIWVHTIVSCQPVWHDSCLTEVIYGRTKIL